MAELLGVLLFFFVIYAIFPKQLGYLLGLILVFLGNVLSSLMNLGGSDGNKGAN